MRKQPGDVISKKACNPMIRSHMLFPPSVARGCDLEKTEHKPACATILGLAASTRISPGRNKERCRSIFVSRGRKYSAWKPRAVARSSQLKPKTAPQ